MVLVADHHLHVNSAGEEERGSDDLNHPYSSPEDEEEYLARDFTAAYEVVHAERLNTMTKAELIAEYQLLEERIEALETLVKTGRSGVERNGLGDGDSAVVDQRMAPLDLDPPGTQTELPSASRTDESNDVQMELSRLREENQRLKAENTVLKKGNQSQAASSILQ